MAGKDSGKERESQRILDRVGRETDSSGFSIVSRATKRTRDHLAGADADQSDAIEYWGTRIGRAIGLAVTIGLVVWLVIHLVRG